MAACTLASDCESNAEVASSNSKIFGSRMRARAIAILWRCPPDKSFMSPTLVLYCSGSSMMKSCALAFFAASSTACVRLPMCRIPTAPTAMLLNTVSAKSLGSCVTTAICWRNHVRSKSRKGTPSSVNDAESLVGSYSRCSSDTIVDFPEPDGPTKAVVFPASNFKDSPSKILAGRLG
mmetsp:Transcript_66953/g.125100  ORF Transcript_66953/g.125100 Transcript_66953/m.125100 type:complete len:178 (+) Transcript_66953:335-868(+)